MLMAKNSELEERNKYLDQEKRRLESDKNQLDANIDSLTKNFEDVTNWLSTNDTGQQIDIDPITEPSDPITRQLLVQVAEDATIEDTLYYMDKKLNSGAVTIETYLKVIRNLAQEQFYRRATIKKLHEARSIRV